MNRIILIGNGFDLAHNLRTSYRHFISHLWEKQMEELRSKSETDFLTVKCKTATGRIPNDAFSNCTSYEDFRKYIQERQESVSCQPKNHFFMRITEKNYANWVDIENEYFEALKECMIGKNKYDIKQLNRDFEAIRQALIRYLNENISSPTKISQNSFQDRLFDEIFLPIKARELTVDDGIKALFESCYDQYVTYRNETDKSYQMTDFFKYLSNNLSKDSLRTRFDDDIKVIDTNGITGGISALVFPKEVLFLSLNYTNTEQMYQNRKIESYRSQAEKLQYRSKSLHIHGTLNNPDTVIFGFGDEGCNDYVHIENLNDKDYLDYFKTILYPNARNYRDLLSFINSDTYQIYIMGASCGTSDKTLLKTLFEHPNCVSIKYYYYKYKEEESKKIRDDYSDIIKNISRCFSEKAMMRSKVVNKEFCIPIKELQS